LQRSLTHATRASRAARRVREAHCQHICAGRIENEGKRAGASRLVVAAQHAAYRSRAPLVDALRPAAAQKNPAFKGSTLYTIFEARRAAPCS